MTEKDVKQMGAAELDDAFSEKVLMARFWSLRRHPLVAVARLGEATWIFDEAFRRGVHGDLDIGSRFYYFRMLTASEAMMHE